MLPLEDSFISEKISIVPVLLAGGAGTRLWPLSRESYPKQFLKFMDGNKSFFQQSLLRLKDTEKIKFEKPIIFTSSLYRFIVEEQLREIEIEPNAIILEPSSKNTGPTVLAAACYVSDYETESLLLFMPTDHLIDNDDEFLKCLERVVSKKLITNISTLGVKPSRPETRYGYIEIEKTVDDSIGISKGFVEKPDEVTVKEMLSKEIFLEYRNIYLQTIIN